MEKQCSSNLGSCARSSSRPSWPGLVLGFLPETGLAFLDHPSNRKLRHERSRIDVGKRLEDATELDHADRPITGKPLFSLTRGDFREGRGDLLRRQHREMSLPPRVPGPEKYLQPWEVRIPGFIEPSFGLSPGPPSVTVARRARATPSRHL